LSILLLCGVPSAERSQIEESLTGSREIRNGDRREFEASIEHALFDSVPSLTARAIVTKVHRLNKSADVGFRRKNMAALLLRYFGDMTKVFRNLDVCLKPGASAFFVIIKSADVLTETAEDLGWKIRERIPITVTTENRRHAKNSITENDIIWCQKPD
jgi:hypothetical protein